MDGLVVVSLRDVEGWRWDGLLPAEAHVCAEDNHCCDVEQAPLQGLEDLELHAVNVAHLCSRAARGVHPEEVQPEVEEGSEVDQVRRRAQLEGLGGAEAELEEMDHHEGE